jgi:hypothetical protein
VSEILSLLFGQKTGPNAFFDLRGGSLPTGVTFTRGSAGWYFNSAGVLTSASSNVPRFDYDPVTLAPLGYLAEMQSTNGLLQSGDVSNAAWTKAQVTATANATTAPDGTVTAASIKEDASAATHGVYQSATLAANSAAGFSAFFKAGTRSKAFINIQSGPGVYATAVFNLSNGTVGETKTSNGTITSTTIRDVGGGWYRIGMIAQITAANPLVVFGLATAASGNSFDSAGAVTYTGDNASLLYGWGMQFDSAGVGVTSYIPTTTATATRSQDILSLPLTSLPGWNASKGGVLVATYRLHTNRGTSGNQYVLTAGESSGNNMVSIFGHQGGGANFFGALVLSGGSGPNDFSPTNAANFVRRRQAVGWGVNLFQDFYDGTQQGKSTGSLALPVGPTTLNLGADPNGSQQANGTLESVAYYAGARSDAFVQQVSR